MPDLLHSRILRVVVLVAALGVGGVAGAPVMTLPPRAGVTVSGGDPDDDEPGGGGGGGGPAGPPEPAPISGVRVLTAVG